MLIELTAAILGWQSIVEYFFFGCHVKATQAWLRLTENHVV